MSEGPRLGFWKVRTIERDPHAVYAIERNGVQIGGEWIFKGQAVREKERLRRVEGANVRDAIRASYVTGAWLIRAK